MSWLKRIFQSRSVQGSEAVQTQVIRLDDQSFHSNEDILEGMQFSATLQIRTPLDILKHHGEIFNGSPSQAPQYGAQADGTWIFKTKTFHELGIALDETESSHASDVGLIEPSRYLPFLIQFRSIVEAELTHEDKLAQLDSLSKESDHFKELWQKLSTYYDDFPLSFFYMPFAGLPGVGRQLAKSLYESGFRSKEQIVMASVLELIAVPGLGKTTAGKIKATDN